MRWQEVQGKLEAEGFTVARESAWQYLKANDLRPPQDSSGFGVYTSKHLRALRGYFKVKRTYRKRAVA